MYVAGYKSNAIQIYAQDATNHAPCGTITVGVSGPLGICVDAKGTLYVANINGSTVTEYRRNTTMPSVTLSTDVREPTNTFVGRDGTLYVSELAYGRVLEFARGARSPTREISIPGPESTATDNENNLYVSYNGFDGKGHVREFKPRATTGTDLITIGFAGDTKLTAKNALLIGDTINYLINIYPSGKTSPSRSIATPNNLPFNFALNRAQTRLYVGTGAHVSVYAFQTGVQVGTITNGITFASGVALDPSALHDE